MNEYKIIEEISRSNNNLENQITEQLYSGHPIVIPKNVKIEFLSNFNESLIWKFLRQHCINLDSDRAFKSLCFNDDCFIHTYKITEKALIDTNFSIFHIVMFFKTYFKFFCAIDVMEYYKISQKTYSIRLEVKAKDLAKVNIYFKGISFYPSVVESDLRYISFNRKTNNIDDCAKNFFTKYNIYKKAYYRKRHSYLDNLNLVKQIENNQDKTQENTKNTIENKFKQLLPDKDPSIKEKVKPHYQKGDLVKLVKIESLKFSEMDYSILKANLIGKVINFDIKYFNETYYYIDFKGGYQCWYPEHLIERVGRDPAPEFYENKIDDYDLLPDQNKISNLILEMKKDDY